MTMQTSLVNGTLVSVFDDALSIAIGFNGSPPITSDSLVLFGIENEFGHTYRIVGVDDLFTLMHIIRRVTRLHYTVRTLNPITQDDLRAIIEVPKMV
jgi:hypothetical protein